MFVLTSEFIPSFYPYSKFPIGIVDKIREINF